MIASLDSSFSRPDAATAATAYAAGVRVWGGYFGSVDGLGLATRWSRADFDVVRNAGMTAIGFCSGRDDPVWIRDTATAWGILACVDVERFIRDDGPWVDGWLASSQSGLYGNGSVHFETGQPVGRGAAFNIVSGYYGYDPRATWEPWLPLPAAPTGWQWRGGHSEFGLDVDSSWLDDWFLPSFTSPPIERQPLSGGARMFDFRPGSAELRADLVYVDQQGHLKHRWANGGITGLLSTSAGEEDLSAGLQFAPLSAACRWDPAGANLNISAVGLDGVLYGLYKDVTGNGPGWFTATSPRAAVGQPGPAGPAGPKGDPGTVDAALRAYLKGAPA